MQITFLVGNGFDIAAGVDTSYGAFYNWYCVKKSNIEHIKKFRQEIRNDVKNGGSNWADFEIGLGQYTKNFTPSTVNEFFDCYEDAHEHIVQFLEEQKAKNKNESLSEDQIDAFTDNLLHFYQDLFPQERMIFTKMLDADTGYNTVVHFLSFNYTNILDSIVERISRKPLREWAYGGQKRKFVVSPKVIHTHGTSTQYPILGVNDASQIANQELLKVPNFSEVMIKPSSVKAVGQLWHADAEALISSSDIVCVFGMSLGESDAKWWGKLLQWMKEGPRRHLILYWHTAILPNRISVLKELEQQRIAKEKFFKYLSLSEKERNSIEPRVHVVLNTKNVLNIQKMD